MSKWTNALKDARNTTDDAIRSMDRAMITCLRAYGVTDDYIATRCAMMDGPRGGPKVEVRAASTAGFWYNAVAVQTSWGFVVKVTDGRCIRNAEITEYVWA